MTRAHASLYNHMPILRILCPAKRRPFSTGVEVSIEDKDKLRNITKFSQCPFCHKLHGWTPSEAFFGDSPPNTIMLES